MSNVASWLEHSVIALVIQAVTALVTGSWWYGAVFASGIFIAREHAQREFEISRPHLLHGYEAFDFWNWSRDAQLDLLCPTLAVIIVALVVQHFI